MTDDEIGDLLDGLSTEDLVTLRDEILAMLHDRESVEDHPQKVVLSGQ